MWSLSSSFLLLLIGSSQAFTTVSPPQQQHCQHHHLLSAATIPVDEMILENVAAYCLTHDNQQPAMDECDLEDHQAIINALRAQREWHQARLEAANDLLQQLGDDDDTTSGRNSRP